jgi:transposase
MREPGRQREALTATRLKVENQMRSLLARFGIAGFRPRLKKAAEHLERLRAFDGRPLPPNTKANLERLLAQHRLLSQQLKEIETARERVLAVADPDRMERMIQSRPVSPTESRPAKCMPCSYSTGRTTTRSSLIFCCVRHSASSRGG